MKPTKLICIFLILLSFALAFYFYPLVPDKIASHWGVMGEPNAYSSKASLFFLPIILLVLFLFLTLLPRFMKIDQKTEESYDKVILGMVLFFIYIQSMIIAFNFYSFNFGQLLIPASSLLFIFIGYLMKDIRRNPIFGIRTPWTMKSEDVWKKTHELGSTMFMISGMISLFGLLSVQLAVLFIIAPVILSSIYLILYSYALSRKEKIS